MHYNLLNYGNYESYTGCTTSNNSTSDKNTYLNTIVNYAQPHIITVNEIMPYTSIVEELLNDALNTGGVTYFRRADVTGTPSVANMVYYDSRVVGLISQQQIRYQY